MSVIQYEIFVQSVLALSKSMIVKHHPTALLMNSEIRVQEPVTGVGVDASDMKTWKYYMNLAGQYHPLDETMVITSLDTTKEIIFNRENMLIHRATYKEYSFGSQYYAELVKKYPKQEDLIKGILMPIDIDYAIDAPDYTILSWDKAGVEPNESNLMEELQDWCYTTTKRWVVKDYGYSDELYHLDILAKIHMFIPVKIMDIRLFNCNTYKAHSFHIWNYLDSHGSLSQYKDFLTRTQTLWLYRNIEWVMNNAGREETFQTLVENILTPRGVPLGSYTVRHNTANMQTELRPSVEAVRRPINLLDRIEPEPEINTIEYVMERSIPLAKDNLSVLEDNIQAAKYKFSRGLISETPVKVYESEMLDTTDSQSIRLGDVLVMNWAYLSANKRYNSVVNIQNPYTTELMQMTVKEAFIVWIYATNKLLGFELGFIPEIVANNVPRIPVPEFSELRGRSSREHITDAAIDHMIDMQPSIGSIISTESFNELCVELHQTMLELEYQWENKTDLHVRANYELVARSFYGDHKVVLSTVHKTYDQFFDEKGWWVAELSDTDLELLSKAIYSSALGIDVSNKKTVKEIQEALLKLMAQLGTYDTQYIRSINTSPAVPLDQHHVLLAGMDQGSAHSFYSTDVIGVKLQSLDVTGSLAFEFEMPDLDVELGVIHSGHINVDLELGLLASVGKVRHVTADFGGVDVDMPGIGNYDELNFDGTVLNPIISLNKLVDLADDITREELDGLDKPQG